MDARRNQRFDGPEIAGKGPAMRRAARDGVSTGSREPGRRGRPKTGTLTSDCVDVIPCYNERRRLDADAFREFLLDHENIGFLLVNDGSTDGTRELLDELVLGNPERLSVLHLERNGGKAEAVRRGLLEAAARGVRLRRLLGRRPGDAARRDSRVRRPSRRPPRGSDDLWRPGAAAGPPDRPPAAAALSRSRLRHDGVAGAGRAALRHPVRRQAVPRESRGRATVSKRHSGRAGSSTSRSSPASSASHIRREPAR